MDSETPEVKRTSVSTTGHITRAVGWFSLCMFVLFVAGCVAGPVRIVRYIEGTSSRQWGFNYGLRPVQSRHGVMMCDLRTEVGDQSLVQLVTAESYVVDPAGKKRGIVVLRDYREPQGNRMPWYRIWFKLDDQGKPFSSGVYTMHLELDEGGRVSTYHGRWEITVGMGSPL